LVDPRCRPDLAQQARHTRPSAWRAADIDAFELGGTVDSNLAVPSSFLISLPDEASYRCSTKVLLGYREGMSTKIQSPGATVGEEIAMTIANRIDFAPKGLCL
jgi:hypothetical protein